MHKFDFTGLAELTDWLCQADVPVYLTIDLDCLDPSAFPGTGTPEAGGVSFLQLLGAIRTVTKANIIGADVNELAPMLDQRRRFHGYGLQGAAGAAAGTGKIKICYKFKHKGVLS